VWRDVFIDIGLQLLSWTRNETPLEAWRFFTFIWEGCH